MGKRRRGSCSREGTIRVSSASTSVRSLNGFMLCLELRSKNIQLNKDVSRALEGPAFIHWSGEKTKLGGTNRMEFFITASGACHKDSVATHQLVGWFG